jgi:hypothetical protein
MKTDGYMEDAQGRLVPLDQIKEIDMARHELVMELVEQFQTMREQMRALKIKIMDDVESFVQISAELYGANVGGKKGNVTLVTFDGRYKLVRQISEFLTFDERLQAAEELIRQCIKEWSEGSNSKIQALVNDAFDVDKQGRINTGRILGLRRLKIDDERWKNAMEAISDSLQVTGSKTYVRLYERRDDGSYKPLPLDIAAI